MIHSGEFDRFETSASPFQEFSGGRGWRAPAQTPRGLLRFAQSSPGHPSDETPLSIHLQLSSEHSVAVGDVQVFVIDACQRATGQWLIP